MDFSIEKILWASGYVVPSESFLVILSISLSDSVALALARKYFSHVFAVAMEVEYDIL
jgi:hypothetical protein